MIAGEIGPGVADVEADIRAIGRGPNSAWGDALVEGTDARTMLLVPLRKDGALLGFISAFRLEVRPFS